MIGYELPTTGSSYLNKGSNGALFYAHVKPVDDMLGEVYIAPPPNTGSVLAGTTLLQLLAKDLHQKPDIQALKTDMLQWPVSMHARLVLMAGAFTNVIWPLDGSYAEDKQKFGIALTEHSVSNFDAAFVTVPKVIPIHFLPTAQISVTAIINARIPIVIVPPMTIIVPPMTMSYYQTALGASLGIDKTLIERALAAYNHRMTPISAFRTDPCLFPRYAFYSIEDYSLGNSECYPSHEGRRMVRKAQESPQHPAPSLH